MIRILLVASYASVRAGLHVLLADAEHCVIVGQASGSGELERLLPGLRPDVVLLDSRPGEVGHVVELLTGGTCGLVLLGDGQDEGLPLLNSALVGWAWLRKDADGTDLVAAIRVAAAGLVALDPALMPFLTRAIVPARDDAPADETLTAREREVLQLMAQGLPNKQIAARLSVSLHTVKFHVASILAKLGVAGRTEAVTSGARRGLVLL